MTEKQKNNRLFALRKRLIALEEKKRAIGSEIRELMGYDDSQEKLEIALKGYEKGKNEAERASKNKRKKYWVSNPG